MRLRIPLLLLASCFCLCLNGTAGAQAKSSRAPRSTAKVNVPSAPAEAANQPGDVHALRSDGFPTERPAGKDLLLAKDDEKRADAYAAFAQGIVAEDDSENDTALADYRRALDLDPSNTELAAKVAAMLIARDDPSSAIQALKDNAKAAPKSPLPLVILSKIYAANLKKPDLAMKYAEQALALDPNYFPTYFELFNLLVAQGQQAKAEQLIDRAAKSATTDANYWLGLGELYAGVHLHEDGTPDKPENLKQANLLFRKAAEYGPEDAEILAKVGNFFIDSRQLKEAITYYSKAVSLKSAHDNPTIENAREKLARALSQTGDRDKAIEVLEEITKAEPLNFEMFEFLGEQYEQKGEIEKALAAYQHSTLVDASSSQNYMRLIDMEVKLKRFDEAVESAKAARAKFPDDPETHYTLAVVLGMAKRNDEAMTAFAEAKAEFETNNHEEFLNSAFYFSYGAAAEQAGLTDKAADLLKKSIELDPRNPQAYNYLGYMWADRGENLEEAAEMINKALEEEPDNGAFMDSLGWLYYKKGEFDKALAELKQASEALKPEDATVFDHLGDAYLKTGSDAEALQCWEKAVAMHQPDLNEKKVMAKIEALRQKNPALNVPAPASSPASSAGSQTGAVAPVAQAGGAAATPASDAGTPAPRQSK